MEAGIYVDLRNTEGAAWAAHYGRWLERIQGLDASDAGSVWLTEHHFFDDGYLPQPLCFAAAIAARTRRIKIGVAVMLAPLHAAIEIAEQAAVVDILSGGRLELGLGLGYRPAEFQGFKVEQKDLYTVFESRVQDVRGLWGDSDDGRLRVSPAPLQHPMPLWCGFSGPRGARMAGRLGAGLVIPRLAGARAVASPYISAMSQAGVGRPRLAGLVEVLVARDPERAWARAKSAAAGRWDSYARHAVRGTNATVPDPLDPDQWRAAGNILVCTPQEICSQVGAWTDGLPVEHVLFWGDFPGAPEDVVNEHWQLVTTEVAEGLKRL